MQCGEGTRPSPPPAGHMLHHCLKAGTQCRSAPAPQQSSPSSPRFWKGESSRGLPCPAAGLRKGGGSTSRAHHQLWRFNSRTGLTSVGPDVCPKGQTRERAEGMGQDAVVFMPPLAAAPGKVCCSSGGVGGQRLPTYSR